MANPDDRSLIESTLRGKTQVFEVLVRRYQRPVYSFAYRMLGSREDAEDIAQEAWLRAYRSLKRFDTSRTFLAWILKIISNLCIDRFRRETSYEEVAFDGVADEAVWSHGIGTWSGTPDTDLYREEIKSRVEAAIAALAPHYRAVIVLRHIEDLSYEEIAGVLDIPVGTVMGRLFRARKLLSERLKDLVEE